MADPPSVPKPKGDFLDDILDGRTMGIPNPVFYGGLLLVLVIVIVYMRNRSSSSNSSVVPLADLFTLPYSGGFPVQTVTHGPIPDHHKGTHHPKQTGPPPVSRKKRSKRVRHLIHKIHEINSKSKDKKKKPLTPKQKRVDTRKKARANARHEPHKYKNPGKHVSANKETASNPIHNPATPPTKKVSVSGARPISVRAGSTSERKQHAKSAPVHSRTPTTNNRNEKGAHR